MPQSRLPAGGSNLFQDIKKATDAAEAEGQTLIKLTIGEPQIPALFSARQAAAEFILSEDRRMHGYQDNSCLLEPTFARRFVAAHLNRPLDLEDAAVGYLPIPGIKPMLGLVPIACGLIAERRRQPGAVFRIGMTTKPGYPTPRVWARDYLGADVDEFLITTGNAFNFDVDQISGGSYDLIMINYPHNPTGQVAEVEWLEKVCEYCVRHGTRLFNDAAYAKLSHTINAVTLTEVALKYPELSWLEAFSASKSIGNGTGWRVGAAVGSPDFINDLEKIKGNTDSGFAAPLALGALHALEYDEIGIEANRLMYDLRLDLLGDILSAAGMQLAIPPRAGFFSLWKSPDVAFGQKMESAEQFNLAMINNTGLVGVHFDPFIRYAVVEDVEVVAERIAEAFQKAQVEYN